MVIKKPDFRTEILRPKAVSYGIMFMLPSVVMDIFVHICEGKSQFTSGGAIVGWRSRFRFNLRRVRFWIEGGRFVTANRLV
jgi:hypothetical protein